MDKDKRSETVGLIEVATQVEKMIQLPDGTNVDITTYLVWLGNQILDIKKQI